MKTLTLRSEILSDGTLRLEVPSDLPPGPVEVVVVLQSTTEAEAEPGAAPIPRSARSGLFLDRAPRGLDPDAVLSEHDQQWKDKLADLKP